VGQDLNPDSRGYLNINNFMWAMSRPLLVEVLAPSAPKLLLAFKNKVLELKTAFLKHKAELTAKNSTIAAAGREPSTKSPNELKAMERAYHDNVLTKQYTIDTVRIFLNSIHTSFSELDTAAGAGATGSVVVASDTSTRPKTQVPDRSKTAAGQHLVISGLHVRILVEKMDCESSTEREHASSAGAVTEESMLAVLRDFAHDQVFEEDLKLFQSCLSSMIHRALEDAADEWVDPDKRTMMKAAKELTGVVIHSKGVLSQVGRAPLSRGHMRPFFSEHDSSNLPSAMRASGALKMLAERRERDVYSSNPWKTYWQESGRKTRMAFDGSSSSAAPGGQLSSAHLLAGAQDKVRRALFQRFDNIASAFVSMDHTGKGVVSTADFRKGIADLRIGLTTHEVEALVSAQGDAEFIIYKDFLEKYATAVANLSDIAHQRTRAGIYSRLRRDLAPREALDEGDTLYQVHEEGEDPERNAARAAAGLVPYSGAPSLGSQV